MIDLIHLNQENKIGAKTKIIKDETACIGRLQYMVEEQNNIRWHGVSSVDKSKILKIIETCKFMDSKVNGTKFPDFVSEIGYIEHFQVSSAKEKDDSSICREALGVLESQNEKKLKELKSNGLFIDSESNSITYNDFSKEYFEKSFKRVWNKHIESLNTAIKEQRINGTCIFLIDYIEDGLVMDVTISDKIQKKLYNKYSKLYPYLWHLSRYRSQYSIALDKDILEYVKDNAHEVDFIIFINCMHFVDIIDIHKILPMMSILNKPETYACDVTYVLNSTRTVIEQSQEQ